MTKFIPIPVWQEGYIIIINQSLAIYNNDNLPSSIKMTNMVQKFDKPSTKNCPKSFKILPNLVTLCHTDSTAELSIPIPSSSKIHFYYVFIPPRKWR